MSLQAGRFKGDLRSHYQICAEHRYLPSPEQISPTIVVRGKSGLNSGYCMDILC